MLPRKTGVNPQWPFQGNTSAFVMGIIFIINKDLSILQLMLDVLYILFAHLIIVIQRCGPYCRGPLKLDPVWPVCNSQHYYLKAPISRMLKLTYNKCHQMIRNVTGISIYIKLDYWYVSYSNKWQYKILIGHFCYYRLAFHRFIW